MSSGVLVLLAVLLLATAAGLAKRWYDGRFHMVGVGRRSAAEPGEATAGVPADSVSSDGHGAQGQAVRLHPRDLGGAVLGPRATLVQFSSAFCQPCVATRHVLAEVADVVPGVAHVEIDAESNLDLVRRLGVLRTPTTLVLDAAGRVTTRASGRPRKEQVLAALPLGEGE